jgi:hypothetical protein
MLLLCASGWTVPRQTTPRGDCSTAQVPEGAPKRAAIAPAEGVTYRRYVASQRVKSRGVPNGLNPLVCPMGAVRSARETGIADQAEDSLNLCLVEASPDRL